MKLGLERTGRWSVLSARRAALCLLLAPLASALAQPEAAAPKRFSPRPDEAYSARVTRVSDGDTLWVKPLGEGRYRKLRLDGIDAPEICQDGGSASRAALAARVMGKAVVVNERRRDDYGRPLVKLRLGEEDVAAWLVSEGWAWSYHWRHSQGPYADQEERARGLKKGLFAQPSPELPRDFRRRHGPCPLPERPAANNQLR